MKMPITINLTEDFITACQIYNLRLKDALKCYADKVIVYKAFTEMHNQHESFASRIFFELYFAPRIEDVERNTKCAHQQANKDGIIGVLKLIVEGASANSKRYKEVIKKWMNDLELHFNDSSEYGKQPGAINLELNLSKDFILMCHFNGFSPSHAFQFFIDRVSLPKLFSKYPDGAYSDVTRFFFMNIRTSYGKEVREEIAKRASKCYEEEMVAYLKRRRKSSNQPKLETLIRKKIEVWCKEYVAIMNQLKMEGHDIEIIHWP